MVRGALVAVLVACRAPSAERVVDLQIVGESTRVRLEDAFPATSPLFDGERVHLVAARGETIGFQVLHRDGAPVHVHVEATDVEVQTFEVEAFAARRGSTAMYGATRGRGTYPDALTRAEAPATNPVYVELTTHREASPGPRRGTIEVGSRQIPLVLDVQAVALPPLPRWVWAYGDPRELAWRHGPAAGSERSEEGQTAPDKADAARATPSADELACVEMFASYGVLLTPDVHLDGWPARKHLLAGVRDVPVHISRDPAIAAAEVNRWIELTEGTGQVPFAIPIDEPRTADKRTQLIALARAVRAAGGGPGRFHLAVTDAPRPEYGDLIDLTISMTAAHREGDRKPRWTYNGAHPYAGSMVLDAITPGLRTWGWIAWRWNIPTWYVWDALYWHDRHNRRGGALPGRALDPTTDPVSFDDGEDRGNLDGVLALPAPDGCQPTLRLAQLRRGLQDRQLLDAAARCAPDAAARIAARLVPTALADAPGGGKPSRTIPASWPTREEPWEAARRELLELASCE